jgi:hypothetical protein
MADLWLIYGMTKTGKSYSSRPYAKGSMYDVLSPDIATGSSRRSGTLDANGPTLRVIWNGTGVTIRIGAKAHSSRSRTLRARRVRLSDGRH